MRRAAWFAAGAWTGLWIAARWTDVLLKAADVALERARGEREELRRGLDLYRAVDESLDAERRGSPAFVTAALDALHARHTWELEHGAKYPRRET